MGLFAVETKGGKEQKFFWSLHFIDRFKDIVDVTVAPSRIDGGSVAYDIICLVSDLVNEFENKYNYVLLLHMRFTDLWWSNVDIGFAWVNATLHQ